MDKGRDFQQQSIVNKRPQSENVTKNEFVSITCADHPQKRNLRAAFEKLFESQTESISVGFLHR